MRRRRWHQCTSLLRPLHQHTSPLRRLLRQGTARPRLPQRFTDLPRLPRLYTDLAALPRHHGVNRALARYRCTVRPCLRHRYTDLFHRLRLGDFLQAHTFHHTVLVGLPRRAFPFTDRLRPRSRHTHLQVLALTPRRGRNRPPFLSLPFIRAQAVQQIGATAAVHLMLLGRNHRVVLNHGHIHRAQLFLHTAVFGHLLRAVQ